MFLRTTSIATFMLALCLVMPATWAQTVFDDRDVGSVSPILDSEPVHTRGTEYDGLKPGSGREEVYFAFSPCLKTGWIKRQQLSADQWRVEVEKMAVQCGIAPLSPEETDVIVGYLATYYGPAQ